MRILECAVLTTWLSLAVACGGGGAEAPAKEADKAAAKAPSADEASDESSESEGDKSEKSARKGKDGEKEKDKSEPDPETGMPKPQRSTQDIITAPDVSFVLAFTNSEPGEKAEKACDAKAKDNAKKRNQCMAKARKEIVEDIMQFSKDKSEKWWWTVSRMTGQKLKALHKVQIEFADEKNDSIALKLVGKDRGTKPWRNPPGKVTIKVPNEFSIEIEDPTHGKLVYEAKIGIVGKE